MRQQFSLELVNDHMVIPCGDVNVLLDTGSPASMGNIPSLSFMGASQPLRDSIMGMVRMDTLKPLTGETKIDALLGMDIMGRWTWEFDCIKKTVVVSEERMPPSPGRLTMDSVMGVPTLDVACMESFDKAAVDTGAMVSYSVEPLEGVAAVREVRDFNPLMGPFMTSIYPLQFRLGETVLDVDCGVLPSGMYRNMLKMVGIRWILGSDLFRKSVVTIDFPGHCMTRA